MMDDEIQLMADSCASLLRVFYGESNWSRWNEVKQQSQLSSTQEFMAWLLDLAEQELNKSQFSFEEPENHEGQYKDRDNERGTATSNKKRRLSHTYEHVEYEPISSVSNWIQDLNAPVDHNEPDVDLKQEPTSVDYNGASTSAVTDLPAVEIFYVRDSKTFFCNKCKVSLTDIEVVKEHLNIRHGNGPLALMCDCCNQKFPSVPDYVNYHKSTVNDPSKAFVCDLCAKGFKGRQGLVDHIANKHQKSGPRYACSHCGKRFSHACSLSTHKKKCLHRLSGSYNT